MPLKFLELTKDNQYHMCLAHLVLQSDEYASFYRRMSNEGKYVLVDNGAAESQKMTYDDLMRVYEKINPTEIVLPDVLFNMDGTIARTSEFLEEYGGDLSKYKKMIVPQGTTEVQWLKCLREMLEIGEFDTIGVPKWLGARSETARVKISLELSDSNVEVHLLGCSENPIIVQCCRAVNPNVRGCDSAFAYICAKAGYNGIDAYTTRPRASINFLEDTEEGNLRLLMDDFEILSGVLNNFKDKSWR